MSRRVRRSGRGMERLGGGQRAGLPAAASASPRQGFVPYAEDLPAPSRSVDSPAADLSAGAASAETTSTNYQAATSFLERSIAQVEEELGRLDAELRSATPATGVEGRMSPPHENGVEGRASPPRDVCSEIIEAATLTDMPKYLLRLDTDTGLPLMAYVSQAAADSVELETIKMGLIAKVLDSGNSPDPRPRFGSASGVSTIAPRCGPPPRASSAPMTSTPMPVNDDDRQTIGPRPMSRARAALPNRPLSSHGGSLRTSQSQAEIELPEIGDQIIPNARAGLPTEVGLEPPVFAPYDIKPTPLRAAHFRGIDVLDAFDEKAREMFTKWSTLFLAILAVAGASRAIAELDPDTPPLASFEEHKHACAILLQCVSGETIALVSKYTPVPNAHAAYHAIRGIALAVSPLMIDAIKKELDDLALDTTPANGVEGRASPRDVCSEIIETATVTGANGVEDRMSPPYDIRSEIIEAVMDVELRSTTHENSVEDRAPQPRDAGYTRAKTGSGWFTMSFALMALLFVSYASNIAMLLGRASEYGTTDLANNVSKLIFDGTDAVVHFCPTQAEPAMITPLDMGTPSLFQFSEGDGAESERQTGTASAAVGGKLLANTKTQTIAGLDIVFDRELCNLANTDDPGDFVDTDAAGGTSQYKYSVWFDGSAKVVSSQAALGFLETMGLDAEAIDGLPKIFCEAGLEAYERMTPGEAIEFQSFVAEELPSVDLENLQSVNEFIDHTHAKVLGFDNGEECTEPDYDFDKNPAIVSNTVGHSAAGTNVTVKDSASSLDSKGAEMAWVQTAQAAPSICCDSSCRDTRGQPSVSVGVGYKATLFGPALMPSKNYHIFMWHVKIRHLTLGSDVEYYHAQNVNIPNRMTKTLRRQLLDKHQESLISKFFPSIGDAAVIPIKSYPSIVNAAVIPIKLFTSIGDAAVIPIFT